MVFHPPRNSFRHQCSIFNKEKRKIYLMDISVAFPLIKPISAFCFIADVRIVRNSSFQTEISHALALLGNNDNRRRYSSTQELISYLHPPTNLTQCVSAQWRWAIQLDIASGKAKALRSPTLSNPALLCLPQPFPILLGHGTLLPWKAY